MMSQELPIDTPVVVADNEFVHVTATRTGADVVKIVYRYPLNSHVVLEMDAAVDGSTTTLTKVDNAFWNITLNGRPTTELELAGLSTTAQMQTEAVAATRELKLTSN